MRKDVYRLFLIVSAWLKKNNTLLATGTVDLQELVEEREKTGKEDTHDPVTESHDGKVGFIFVGDDGGDLGNGRVLLFLEGDGCALGVNLFVFEFISMVFFLVIGHGGGSREGWEEGGGGGRWSFGLGEEGQPVDKGGKERGCGSLLYFIKRELPSMMGTFDVKFSLRHLGEKKRTNNIGQR